MVADISIEKIIYQIEDECANTFIILYNIFAIFVLFKWICSFESEQKKHR